MFIEPSSDEEDCSSENEAQMVAWMKENMEPVSKVTEYMALTAKQRKHFIAQKHSVADILEKYPRLLDKNMVISKND